MLVLSRKAHQSIRIGDEIEITIVNVRGSVARVGITAPMEVPITRSELLVGQSEIEPETEAPRILRIAE